jgi:ElaB/YqjD/DUF883 family membrane-anchored ribosome-binding protein
MANTTQHNQKEENRANPTLDKAKDVAGQAYDKAKDVASSVGQKADDLTSSAGTQLKNLGDTIRERAPHEGMLGSAAQGMARTLRDSGEYLENAGLSGIGEDLTTMIRKNPVPAVLVGIGFGFILGRMLRS